MMRNKLRTWKFTVAYPVLLWCLSVGLAYGASNGEKTKVQGVIATRTGETLVLSTDSGNVTVVLTDDTKVQQPKGLGLRHKQMSTTILIPGLRISVDGVGDGQSRVTAKSINFNSDDLEMAEAIQAGLTPTKHNVQTNAQNIQANKKATNANAKGIAANQAQNASNQQAIANNQEQIDANQQQIQDNSKRFSMFFSPRPPAARAAEVGRGFFGQTSCRPAGTIVAATALYLPKRQFPNRKSGSELHTKSNSQVGLTLL
jgi:hypothetical protein